MIDLSYLDEHRGYIGTSGSGKSTTARDDVEQLLRESRHTCVVDITGIWYGLRSDRAGTGPGFDIPVFGGRRGDVPIGAGDGAAIGKIVGDGVSAIVDLSALRTGKDQRDFMAEFIAAIRAKPPGHFQLVCDEADEYVPEKGGIRDGAHQQVAEDMIWIAKRGRTDGYVLSLITQRLADVANAAFSQVQTIFAHQLTAPTDMTAFGKYVKAHGTKAEYAEIMAGLPSLQAGQRYLYRPRLHFLELGTSPLPTTFDSSRTPGPGEARREPKLLSQIDVRAIAKLLEKPKLEVAIAAYDAGGEMGALLIKKDERIRALEDELAELRARSAAQEDTCGRYQGAVSEAIALLEGAFACPLSPDSAGAPPRDERPPAPGPSREAGGGEARRVSAKAPVSASPENRQSVDLQNLVRGKKALQALVRNPEGLTERQWAWIAGSSRKGGTWGTYKSALMRAGLVVEQDGLFGHTAAGHNAAGDCPTFPRLGPELAAFWGAKLPGVRRMVDQLVDRWPNWTLRANLADALSMAADGGTFGTYLSRLKSAQLIQQDGKKIRLHPELMGGE